MSLYPAISSLPLPLRDPEVVVRLKQLAMEHYPAEFCALILHDGEIVVMRNEIEGPESGREFKLDMNMWVTFEERTMAVIHSHPDGPAFPTATDMEFGEETGKIMGLFACGKEWASDPFWWGEGVPTPPLVGRKFRHGPGGTDGGGDCYAIIKDFYAECRSVKIPEFPRDWEWWSKADLYTEGFPKAGFKPIEASEARPGDVFLACVRSKVPNHGGILWDNSSILHHLVDRLSARAANGPWHRQITHWLRYEDDLPPWDPRKAIR